MEIQSVVPDPAAQAIIDAFVALYQEGGWLAVAGLCIVFGVRAFKEFGGGPLWARLRLNVQRLIVFASGAVGAVIIAVATGKPLLMALPGGLLVGAAAMLKHKLSEKVGEHIHLTGNPKTDRALRLALGGKTKPPRQRAQQAEGAK